MAYNPEAFSNKEEPIEVETTVLPSRLFEWLARSLDKTTVVLVSSVPELSDSLPVWNYYNTLGDFEATKEDCLETVEMVVEQLKEIKGWVKLTILTLLIEQIQKLRSYLYKIDSEIGASLDQEVYNLFEPQKTQIDSESLRMGFRKWFLSLLLSNDIDPEHPYQSHKEEWISISSGTVFLSSLGYDVETWEVTAFLSGLENSSGTVLHFMLGALSNIPTLDLAAEEKQKMEKLANKIQQEYARVSAGLKEAFKMLKDLLDSSTEMQSAENPHKKESDPQIKKLQKEIDDLKMDLQSHIKLGVRGPNMDPDESGEARRQYDSNISHKQSQIYLKAAELRKLNDKPKNEVKQLVGNNYNNYVIEQILSRVDDFIGFFTGYPFLNTKLPEGHKIEFGEDWSRSDPMSTLRLLQRYVLNILKSNISQELYTVTVISTILANQDKFFIPLKVIRTPYSDPVYVDFTKSVEKSGKRKDEASERPIITSFQPSPDHNTQAPIVDKLVAQQIGWPPVNLEIADNVTKYNDDGNLEQVRIASSHSETLTSILNQPKLNSLIPHRSLILTVSSSTSTIPFIPNTKLLGIYSNPRLKFEIQYDEKESVCGISLIGKPDNLVKVTFVFADNVLIPSPLFSPKEINTMKEGDAREIFAGDWAELGIPRNNNLYSVLEDLRNQVNSQNSAISEQTIFKTIWDALTKEEIPYSFAGQSNLGNNYYAATKVVLEDVFNDQKGLICSTACLVLGTLLRCFGVDVAEISGYMAPKNLSGIVTAKNAHGMLQVKIDGENRVVDAVNFLIEGGGNELLARLEKETLNGSVQEKVEPKQNKKPKDSKHKAQTEAEKVKIEEKNKQAEAIIFDQKMKLKLFEVMGKYTSEKKGSPLYRFVQIFKHLLYVPKEMLYWSDQNLNGPLVKRVIAEYWLGASEHSKRLDLDATDKKFFAFVLASVNRSVYHMKENRFEKISTETGQVELLFGDLLGRIREFLISTNLEETSASQKELDELSWALASLRVDNY